MLPIKAVLHDFLTLLFPQFCYACEQSLYHGERVICTACLAELPYTTYHLQPENDLQRRFWGKVPVGFVVAYMHLNPGGKVASLLHQLKYRGAQQIGLLLGNWYGAVLLQNGFKTTTDAIVPVPLHTSKLRKRGYNQAEVFGQGLAETLLLPLHAHALKRNTATNTQTKKARLQRWQNVEGIFSVPDPELVKGKRILLVDDVLTTGSTLEACAQALYNAGCAQVHIAVIAAAR